MATLYAIACSAHKEKIDPSSINGMSAKLSKITDLSHPVGSVVLHAMWALWDCNPITLVADTALEDPVTGEQPYDDYIDVTEAAIVAYNDLHDTDLQYTP